MKLVTFQIVYLFISRTVYLVGNAVVSFEFLVIAASRFRRDGVGREPNQFAGLDTGQLADAVNERAVFHANQ